MDQLLREDIWLRRVGMTGLYLMAIANNLLTVEKSVISHSYDVFKR